MIFASAGILKKKEKADIEFVPLIETSVSGMQVSTAKLGIFAKPEELMRDYMPQGKLIIAARISGKLKSAYSGQPASEGDKDKPESGTDKSYLAETKEPAHIIVVADADFFT